MPTVNEFDLAAAAFTRASEDAQALIGRCRPFLGPDVVDGGALAELVEITMDVSDQNMVKASTGLADLASICRHRAEISRAYAADLNLYHHQVDRWRRSNAALPPGEPLSPRPRPPNNPPAWVTS